MLTSIKSLVRRVARRYGYYIDRYPPAGSLLRELQILLADLQINCVLDVGAHHGETGLKLRQLGYEGHIVSFEPVPESFRVLRAQCDRDPKWLAYPIALGAVEGVAAINVMAASVLTSFLTWTDAAANEFPLHRAVLRREMVEIRRLDRMLDQCIADIASPSVFLKTDTQGYDLQVIQGAGDRVTEIRGLLAELAAKPLYQGVTPFADAISQLGSLGFEVVALEPLSRDSFRRVLEFDCLMRRAPGSR